MDLIMSVPQALRAGAGLLPGIVDPTGTGLLLPMKNHVHAAILHAVNAAHPPVADAPEDERLAAMMARHAVVDHAGHALVAHLVVLGRLREASVEPTWNRIGNGIRGMGVWECAQMMREVAGFAEIGPSL